MNETILQVNELIQSLQGFGTFDYVVFVFMLISCAGIGLYYALHGNKSADAEIELLMGGRNMKVFPVAMSLVASFISGITLLGNPTEAYLYGTAYFFTIFVLMIVSFPASYVFLPVFHDMKLASTYEYLERRFDRKLRYFGSVLFTIGLLCWLPIVIYVPALAFNQVTGLNIHIITPCVCIVCIFYTAVGGLKAVVWTDVIQSFIMVGAVILVVIKGSLDAGGFQTVWHRAWESGRIEYPSFQLDFVDRHTFWSLSIGGTVFWLQAAIINQNMIQRYLALPDMTHARRALAMFTVGTVFIIILTGYAGFVVYSTYYDCDPLTTKLAKAKDQLLPLLVARVLGEFPGMPGLFVAGIFSAALSSLSTGLNSISAIVLEDFIKPTMSEKLSNKATEYIIKAAVLIFGIISVGLVFIVEKLGTVLQLSMSLGGMTGGPLFGIFCLGILFPWSNEKGALYGGIVGIICSAIVVMGGQNALASGNLVYPGKPLSIEGCNYVHNSTLLIANRTTLSKEEYVFPLYKISYLWYPVFGSLITFITGVIISFLTGPSDLTSIDHMLLSPVIRKYLPPKSSLTTSETVPELKKMLDPEKGEEKN
ncbi:sodium/solute symporter, putative [Pediculus humanus corporis]|uniref:Sodium/solute symporter, putative n=1 Tax=Pediculus humanus subsp. corporis TaxID=121224 RepID=E0VCA6_PEDHC|nr:sodium/solute symporter, putative [Pediculus humanus corporis]EEB11028.1 sodium/solute symporter, putative [Pediculus humanus corporis]